MKTEIKKLYDGNFPERNLVSNQEQGAQEKGKELVEKYIPPTRKFNDRTGWEDNLEAAKQSAIICVDEQITTINKLLATDLNNDFSLLSERGDLLSVRSSIQEM